LIVLLQIFRSSAAIALAQKVQGTTIFVEKMIVIGIKGAAHRNI
jgi:hypothetical protein